MFPRLVAAAFAVVVMAAPAHALDTPREVKVVQTERGQTLADRKGMTLYTFDRDEAFESSCKSKCAENWPPLKAKKKDQSIGRFLAIERSDGSIQWTYAGKPLYRWHKDEDKGDITGDGLADVWHVAQP